LKLTAASNAGGVSQNSQTTDRQLLVDTMRYDSVYLTCSKKLTGSQLSLPHRINKKLKCETKNKLMSVIGLVQSHYHEGSGRGVGV